MPIEYCDYSGKAEKCKKWLEGNMPDLAPGSKPQVDDQNAQNQSAAPNSENPDATTGSDEKKTVSFADEKKTVDIDCRRNSLSHLMAFRSEVEKD